MHDPNRRLFLGIGFLSMAFWTSDIGADQSVASTLTAIAKERRGTRTLRASFRQTRTLGLLATSLRSQGKLMVVHPDRLRWELKAPDSVTYWVGPEGLAVRSAEGVKKIRRSQAGRFATALFDLLHFVAGDMKPLQQRYRFKVQTNKQEIRLEAVPRDKRLRKQIAKVVLWLPRAELWRVRRIEIHESNGDSSKIDFSGFVKNKKIAAKIMRPPQ
jgi:outer membrane lipoprotein-sorting protein